MKGHTVKPLQLAHESFPYLKKQYLKNLKNANDNAKANAKSFFKSENENTGKENTNKKPLYTTFYAGAGSTIVKVKSVNVLMPFKQFPVNSSQINFQQSRSKLNNSQQKMTTLLVDGSNLSHHYKNLGEIRHSLPPTLSNNYLPLPLPKSRIGKRRVFPIQ